MELGCGHYSTRLLHALCRERQLITLDSAMGHDTEWVDMLSALTSEWHAIHFVGSDIAEWINDRKRLNILPQFSVVFEDSGRAQLRAQNIAAIRDHADLIIVNNTEPDKSGAEYHPIYKYETILPTFPYRFDYKRYEVWTSVVSDAPIPEWLKELV